ncbi:iron chelate uptake ABC transporter family permease subunit [Vibrio sinaloensis]|nr:iron chelate uptake ABC transporter family permease subunit [Vibrio sinaloensis]
MQDKHKLLLLAAIAILFSGLFIGLGLTADNYEYFLSRRVPKVLAMVIAGVSIGLSSLAFQTITHNRILTPSIMGFDSLYLFSKVLMVALFGGLTGIAMNSYVNFVVSLIAMLGFFPCCCSVSIFGVSDKNLMVLLLLGVILGQVFFDSSSAFLIMLMDPTDFAAVLANMFASFNNVSVDLVYLCAPLLCLVSWRLYTLHRLLDVFWLDKDNAISLGVDVKKVTLQILLLSALLISIATALIGPLLFFGLLVTNVTREMFSNYQHKILFVAVALLSVAALLSGQWIVENVFGFTTTLSVVINFIGGLYFF